MTLPSGSRQLYDVPLRVAQGSRFQPTGFPDVGAAVFERPVRDNGEVKFVRALVVESSQSMANHLEGVAWPRGAAEPHPTLDALPYVRVVAREDGRYLTSSRTEAHRLASAFIKDSELEGEGDMRTVIRNRLGLRDDTPLSPRDLARAVFRLDPLCLIHGVFFAEDAKVWPGQPKIARALTAFVEAEDVHEAVFGGVKRDQVRHRHAEGGGSKEGYGSIPFHRTEWTAARITAYFSIDLAQLRSYGLSQPATELLHALAQWEIRHLLDGGLRLRTACDLDPEATDPADRDDVSLPRAEELDDRVHTLASACGEELGDDGAIVVRWPAPKAKV